MWAEGRASCVRVHVRAYARTRCTHAHIPDIVIHREGGDQREGAQGRWGRRRSDGQTGREGGRGKRGGDGEVGREWDEGKERWMKGGREG